MRFIIWNFLKRIKVAKLRHMDLEVDTHTAEKLGLAAVQSKSVWRNRGCLMSLEARVISM